MKTKLLLLTLDSPDVVPFEYTPPVGHNFPKISETPTGCVHTQLGVRREPPHTLQLVYNNIP